MAGIPEPEQITLGSLVGDAVEWSDEAVAVFLLPDLPCPAPSASLIRSVREVGVLEPVILEERGDGFGVVDGKRRIKAARLAGRTDVPARVARGVGAGGIAALTIVANEQRSSNPAAEWDAIRDLQERGFSEAAIARVTGMGAMTIRKRAALGSLVPELAAAFRAGAVPVTVAERAAKLPKERQAELADRLKRGERITGAAVAAAQRARVEAAVASLPGSLFGEDGFAVGTAVGEARKGVDRILDLVQDAWQGRRTADDVLAEIWRVANAVSEAVD